LIRVQWDRVVRDAVVASIAMAIAVAGAGAMWLRMTAFGSVAGFVVWTLAGGAGTAIVVLALSGGFRPADGESSGRLTRVGLPNVLTLARFVLIAPTVVLLAGNRIVEGLVLYIVLFMTDVADGVIARRQKLSSEFGIVADPLADVVSTFAVFTVLVRQGLCPEWVYAILCIRYAMLFAGSLAFFLASGPLHFSATVPGKIVGVVQAAGASILIASTLWGGLDPAIERVLFAFLGIGFASIVVSQAIVGWRFIRRTSRSGLTR
jgi:cardiolipin synthase